MMRADNVYFGWQGNGSLTSVTQFVLHKPDLVSQFQYATISCVDSNRSQWLHSTFPAYARDRNGEEVKYQLVQDGILISGKSLCKIVLNEDLFSGFDEVWFSEEKPIMPKPTDVTLTAEIPITDARNSEVRLMIAEWITKSKYVLGLGDGNGLNYVTVDESIAHLVDTIC